MKTYNVTIEQVSKNRPHYFDLKVDGRIIGEISDKAPSFGSPFGAHERKLNILENAYQTARRVLICENDDIDVFTKGIAKMSFGNEEIKYL